MPTGIASLIGIIHSGLKSEACWDVGVLFQQALFRHLSMKCRERLKDDWSFTESPNQVQRLGCVWAFIMSSDVHF